VFNKHARVMLCRNEVVSIIVCQELAWNVSADATVNLYKVQPVPDVYVLYCRTLLPEFGQFSSSVWCCQSWDLTNWSSALLERGWYDRAVLESYGIIPTDFRYVTVG
jgi:hypothetical protein